MKSLTKEKRYDRIDAFNSTSRYLNDLLNINNIRFEHTVNKIYPSELQLNKANASDTEAAFLDLKISNRKAMNRNWSNQNSNPALKTKTGNKKYYK